MDVLRVAIADDDRIARRSLTQMLENLGHNVVVSAERGALVEQCATMNPDVVITDNLMPDMNGVDAAEAIYGKRPVPIILLSAYCDRGLVLDAEQKHVLVYLVKPIVQSHLEAALARCQSEWEYPRGGPLDAIQTFALGEGSRRSPGGIGASSGARPPRRPR